ncbi:alpha/beta hydrolase fold domain-containing protein [Sarocladium implicatum]|nr:alpha/beta hydrolase fold domain-containing protein [Sarocladium implicatum]
MATDGPTFASLSDGRKLSYALDTSPRDAPIVLLSNSLSAPFTAWDHVVKVLNDKGFRTLRYDQPGHGDSSVPHPLDANTFPSMAADVYALLQSLSIEKVHAWVGVSMGAATGIQFVTTYPGVVDRIAICDTISSSPVNAGTDDLFAPRVASARKEGNMESTIQGTMDRWFGSDWLSANPEEAERMRTLMRRTSIDGFETCCHALRSKTFDLRPLFAKVGGSVKKALCVVGENDANLPQAMETMRGEIEKGFRAEGKSDNVQLKVIKNAGHVCFIDGFEQFCEVILAFLKI